MFTSTKLAFDSSFDEDGLQDPRYDSSDWRVWKATIEKDMLDLRDRVKQIEQKDSELLHISKQNLTVMSFANAEDDGCAGLRTCASLIRKRKAALFQCLWLVIFIVTLGVVGTFQGLRVIKNRQAEFKPEKKLKTMNYADSDSKTPYEMPYIYMYFAIYDESGGNWSTETVNNTLEKLLESQHYFQDNLEITWLDDDLYEKDGNLTWNETDAFSDEDFVAGQSDRFFGYFRLKPNNPDPSMGSFTYQICINALNMTLDRTVKVVGLWISLEKEKSVLNWGDMVRINIRNAINEGSWINATIEYTEKVIHTWNEGTVTRIIPKLTAEEETELKAEEEETCTCTVEEGPSTTAGEETNRTNRTAEDGGEETNRTNRTAEDGEDEPEGGEDEHEDGENGPENGEDGTEEGGSGPPPRRRQPGNGIDDQTSNGTNIGHVAGLVTIVFQGNSMIDHWKEYVEYDILDWLSAMGGMINLASLLFFWGAYYLALLFGESFTMGILPEFSFVFHNLENIRLLRNQVKTE